MEGFSNRQTSKKTQAVIASFKGEKRSPRFQIWNRDFDPNKHQLLENQEVRGGYCYDTHEEFIGYIDAMELVEVEIPYEGVKRKYLRLHVFMAAGGEVILFDLGTYTGRYAQSFLERLLNPSVDFLKPIKMFPYHIPKEGDKPTIGMSVYQDGVKIEFLRKEQKEEIGVPEPDVIETDMGNQWVWGKRIKWIFNNVKNRLIEAKMNSADNQASPPPPPLDEDDLAPSEPIVVEPIEPHPGMKAYPPKPESSPFNNPGFVDPNYDDLPF